MVQVFQKRILNLSEEAKTKIAKAIEELKSGKVEAVATGDELKAKEQLQNRRGTIVYIIIGNIHKY